MAVGNLPLREQASLYAAMGQPSEALQRLQQARDAGQLQPGDEVQIAYFLSQAGDDQGALDTFKRVDRQSGLKPREVQDAAYSAMRTSNDAQAIAYFKRVLDYQQTGDLQMPAQQVFDTRRAVSDLSREWGLTNTTTYRGASTSSGLSGAPGGSNDSVQNSTEVFWRPFGYRNARFVELYGRVTDTLWSKEGDSDTGADALQGALGIRVKPFSAVNVIGAFERTFPLGNSNADGDWLVRLGYGSSIGTDLRVDVPSWWTSQLYAEGGRYLQDKRNYFNSEWQVGRSFRLDSISPRLVVFPMWSPQWTTIRRCAARSTVWAVAAHHQAMLAGLVSARACVTGSARINTRRRSRMSTSPCSIARKCLAMTAQKAFSHV